MIRATFDNPETRVGNVPRFLCSVSPKIASEKSTGREQPSVFAVSGDRELWNQEQRQGT